MSAPAPGRQTGSFGDELTNAAMIGLIGVFALTLLLRGMHLDIVLAGGRTLDADRREEIDWFVDTLVASMDRW